MRLFLASLALASLVASGAAQAACGPGSPTAKPIFFYSADESVLDGLNASLALGLTPASFPAENIGKAPAVCPRSDFASAGQTWTLHGDDGGEPPRWARVGEDDSQIIYLALMPSAEEARAWVQAQRKARTSQATATFKTSMWALVVARGAERHVFEFYDAIPDDARLISDMQAVLNGQTPEVLSFDPASQKADFARTGAPYTLLFMASGGSLALIGKTAPDGRAFKARGDIGVEALASGLNCPTLPGYQRVELVATGTEDGSSEAGCRYASERSRVAIFATSLPKAAFTDVFKIMIAPGAADDSGQPETTPTATPPASLKPMSAFFNAKGGGEYGFWGFQRGKWTFEIYALYGKDGEATVVAAATALMIAKDGSK